MKTKYIILGLTVFALIVVAGIILSEKISDRERVFPGLAKSLSANNYVGELMGSSEFTVRENGGPSETEIASDKLRNGFYSVDVSNSKKTETLKIYWRETSSGEIEISEIYRTKSFSSDQLLWKLQK